MMLSMYTMIDNVEIFGLTLRGRFMWIFCMCRVFSKNLLMNYLAIYHIEKISIY